MFPEGEVGCRQRGWHSLAARGDSDAPEMLAGAGGAGGSAAWVRSRMAWARGLRAQIPGRWFKHRSARLALSLTDFKGGVLRYLTKESDGNEEQITEKSGVICTPTSVELLGVLFCLCLAAELCLKTLNLIKIHSDSAGAGSGLSSLPLGFAGCVKPCLFQF